MVGVTREIKVAIDPDRLNALGVTAGDVNRALRSPMPNEQRQRRFRRPNQTIRTLGGAGRRRTSPRSKSRSLRRPPRCNYPTSAAVTDACGTKSFARLNNQTVVSFVFRGKGESDVDVSGLSTPRSETSGGGIPTYPSSSRRLGSTRGQFELTWSR